MFGSGELPQFIGRLHIVLLHLPIGFLFVLGCLELLSMIPKWRHATFSNRFILWLTAPVTVLTAVCGWFLAESGSYDARLLFLHRWAGIAVAVAACLLLWVHARGWIGVYRLLVLATMTLTICAGHLGGSLTHGRDYITRYAPSWLGGNLESASDTDSVGASGEDASFGEVRAVLEDYCVSCHGPDKSKGGLRLDSVDHLLAGGDSGPVVELGNPRQSLLLKRILLSADDDDHMPPEGKPQPSAQDIELIRSWIESDQPD